jgi:hypothetical protein
MQHSQALEGTAGNTPQPALDSRKQKSPEVQTADESQQEAAERQPQKPDSKYLKI